MLYEYGIWHYLLFRVITVGFEMYYMWIWGHTHRHFTLNMSCDVCGSSLDCTVLYCTVFTFTICVTFIITLLSYCFRAVRSAVDHGPQYWTERICRRRRRVLRGRQYYTISNIWCMGCAYSGNPRHDGGTVCLSSHTSTALVCTAMAGSTVIG
jgi:hypothetical protein